MRTLLPSALATLVTCIPVLAQTFGYEIDVNPPTGTQANNSTKGDWRDPATLTTISQTNRIRIRVNAAPGTWVRPLIDFQLDPVVISSEPMWLENNMWLLETGSPATTVQALVPSLASIYNTNSNNVVLQNCATVEVPRPNSFLRWLTFAVKNGTQAPVSTGVQQWCQPVLNTMPSNPHRLWSANAPLWNTGNGPLSSMIWNGALQREASGNSTFSFFGLLRYAVVEQAAFTGHAAEVEALLNSADWNELIADELVRLAIQVFGLKPPSSQGAPSDGLSDPILPDVPLTYVSPAYRFRVELPEPRLSQFYDLGNVTLVPGSMHRFRCPEGRFPMIIRFPTWNNGLPGFTEMTATAVPSITDPCAYVVPVPTNLIQGAIGVKHGDMTIWVDATTAQPLPN